MIARMQMTNYKGFEKFSLKFASDASILVGPNNAGKSTAIGALRLCAQLLSHAKLRNTDAVVQDKLRGRSVRAYRISIASSGFTDENVAHEFRDVESRVELHFKNKAALYAVWPLGEDFFPYFYLEQIPGAQPPSISVIKNFYPTIGVVQTLTPVEHREVVLSPKYVRDNLGTRLASKHFRNQLYQMELADSLEYREFCSYLIENSPEITRVELVKSHMGEPELDLYFNEAQSKVEKELYWAGDGMQIWLQLLFHIWRHRGVSSLILDEPDVFLHPDLQRRLVKILEGCDSQVIMATHAPEILAESNRDSVVIIDRNRKSSKRIGSDSELSGLNDSLGSGFNLRLAKVLRSRVALFVEGHDMKILSNIAKTLGARKFHRESGLTIVSMGGSSKRRLAESFGWLNTTVLDSSVDVSVILDRDYLSDSSVKAIADEFKRQGVSAHIWSRNEIESYLVSPSAISRLTGLAIGEVEILVEESVQTLKGGVFAEILAREQAADHPKGIHLATTYSRVQAEFDKYWTDGTWRRGIVPGKDLISAINIKLQAGGYKAVSARALSVSLRKSEIPDEMAQVILGIEARLS
ncbi:ATP-dependent nuclease [Nocardia pseudovaccinii]|uniref:ATP-dependent nuclease n=1 Tax=Nocardia pseudovaccinii TaxID=189540 RepID=UPI003D901885